MSSRTPDDGTESSRGSEGIWHPAHEWLEEDELDTEYHPALEPSEHDGAWEDDISNEDQQMGSGVASENTHINIGNIQIELTADDSESEDTDNLNEGHTRGRQCLAFLMRASTIAHELQCPLPDYSSCLHQVVYNISSKPMAGQPPWKKSRSSWKMKTTS
jgi:WD repeat-containing protein 23